MQLDQHLRKQFALVISLMILGFVFSLAMSRVSFAQTYYERWLDLYDLNPSCTPICWDNFSPGTTEMRDIYQWFSVKFSAPVPDDKSDTSATNNTIGVGGEITITAFSDSTQPNPLLRAFQVNFLLRLSNSTTYGPFTMSEISGWLPPAIILQYGQPSAVAMSLSRDLKTIGSSPGLYDLYLDFNNHNVLILYTGTLSSGSGLTSQICPTQQATAVHLWRYSDQEIDGLTLLEELKDYEYFYRRFIPPLYSPARVASDLTNIQSLSNSLSQSQCVTPQDFDVVVSPPSGATDEDVQTPDPLPITVNDRFSTHFKITDITNGTLYQNDGVTAISNGQFITVAQGEAGLRFTPAPSFIGEAGFDVQASLSADDSGLGGDVVRAIITVNPVNDAPTLTPLPPDASLEDWITAYTPSEECPLPCWWGIIPGETSYAEALEIAASRHIEHISYGPVQDHPIQIAGVWYFPTEIESIESQIMLGLSGESVEYVGLLGSHPLLTYFSLLNMLNQYGVPSHIRLDAGRIDQNVLASMLLLDWENISTSVGYFYFTGFAESPAPPPYCFTFENAAIYVFPHKPGFTMPTTIVFPDATENSLRPLSEISDYTNAEFAQILLNNHGCLPNDLEIHWDNP